MIFAVWAPLLLPLLAVPAARRLAGWLPPRTAAWMLAGSAVLLAGAATASLGLLTAAGLLELPPVAAVGHLSLTWLDRLSPLAWPLGAATAAALATVTGLLLRAAVRHHRELAAARSRAAVSAGAPGGLVVVPDDRPDAYALPGQPGQGGRIVVTAGMLRALTAEERSALLAHERAHLAARHHLFLAVAEYAAAAHPALRLLRSPLSYQLERWADESAAASVGSRTLTARAIGRAALATAAAGGGRGPGLAPAAHTGPVPRRVAALLSPRPEQPPTRGRTAVALVLTACLCASAGTVLDATNDLHQTVETAQAAPTVPGHH